MPDKKPTYEQKLQDAYDIWKKNDFSPEYTGNFLGTAQPVIDKAITSFGGGQKDVLSSYAKTLAIDAAKKYDPSHGTKLSNFLFAQMQPMQREYQARTHSLHVPELARQQLTQLDQTEQELAHELGRNPSDIEIAEKASISVPRLHYIRKHYGQMEMPEGIWDAEKSEFIYAGTETQDPQDVIIEYVYHDSDNIDKQIMQYKGGLWNNPVLSTNEIAKKLGISSAAVSQRSARIDARLNRAAQDLL